VTHIKHIARHSILRARKADASSFVPHLVLERLRNSGNETPCQAMV
jgi:hypothetical protein